MGLTFTAWVLYAQDEELYTRAGVLSARVGEPNARAWVLYARAEVLYAQDEELYTRAGVLSARVRS